MERSAAMLMVFVVFGCTGKEESSSHSSSTPTATAASCSQADVQRVVDKASDGDTVLVPPGVCTWNAAVIISNKSISLIGAGIGQTVITGNDTSGGTLGSALRVTTKPSGNFPPGYTRISAFTWKSNAVITSGYAGGSIVSFIGMSKNVRFDHNRVETTTTSGVHTAGAVAGVGDHNELIEGGRLVHQTILTHDNWDGTEPIPSGDTSWASDSTVGTGNVFIWEDNAIINTYGVEGWYCSDDFLGARTVWRFNTLRDCTLSTHGTETGGRLRGYRHREVYRSKFIWSLPRFEAFLANRGGTGMYFDLVGTGDLEHFITMSTYRRDEPFTLFGVSQGHLGSYPFGRCGRKAITSLTHVGDRAIATLNDGDPYSSPDGSYQKIEGALVAGSLSNPYNGIHLTTPVVVNPGPPVVYSTKQIQWTIASDPGADAIGTIIMISPFDTNNQSTGYRCMDQAGAGKSILFTGYGPGLSPTYPDISPISSANNALEPIYVWNNLLNGGLRSISNPGLDVAVGNRDYYNQSSSFDGTVGIGRGPRAARPSTCTAGVAYWSTDGGGNWNTSTTETYSPGAPGEDGGLDLCTSQNTWADDWYVPYIYPHPLVR